MIIEEKQDNTPSFVWTLIKIPFNVVWYFVGLVYMIIVWIVKFLFYYVAHIILGILLAFTFFVNANDNYDTNQVNRNFF